MGHAGEALTLTVRREARSVTIVAAGALDLGTSEQLWTAAHEAHAGLRQIVLDLRGLRFIDSSGLGTLLNLRGELHREGVALSVEVREGPVRRALETTGLGELLDS